MNTNDNGGPAFPCMPPQDTAAGAATGYPYPDAGMTLRDYFAARAGLPPGYFLRNEDEFDGDGLIRWHARWAYVYADAMLAERAKVKP